MASAIDPTVPVTGASTTPSVRDNFTTAKAEITALQTAMVNAQNAITTLQGAVASLSSTFAGGPYMSLAGGAMTGPFRNPGHTSPIVMTRSAAVQPPAIPPDTVLALAGLDGGDGRVGFDLFSAFGSITYRRAEGTGAAPTALRNGSIIYTIAAVGRGTTTWDNIPAAGIVCRATENWTNTANGTGIDITTTLNGTLTPLARMQIVGSGAVLINTTETGTETFQIGGGLRVWPNVRVGALAASPTFTTGSGVGSGNAPAGSVFLRQPGALGARVYVNQNGAGSWLAIAGV